MIRGKPELRRQQRGVAAITAMLVVTIATLLAVELVWDMSLNMRRSESLFLREQAIQFAYGGEALAMKFLRDDIVENESVVDHPGEIWAQNLPPMAVTGGAIDGYLADLQGRFNLNNLVAPNGEKDRVVVEHFRRLLYVLDLPTDLADAVVDWIDANQLPENIGAEDGIYSALSPPYQAANFWFLSTSELLAVNGITPEIYKTLEPFVAALPVSGTSTKINVNTASPYVLASLWPGISVQQAQLWRETTDYFEDLPQFEEVVKLDVSANSTPKLADMMKYLDVGTSYFRLNVIVSIGTIRLSMYSLLERSTDGLVTVRLRSYDTE